jgi:hypothetical protein
MADTNKPIQTEYITISRPATYAVTTTNASGALVQTTKPAAAAPVYLSFLYNGQFYTQTMVNSGAVNGNIQTFTPTVTLQSSPTMMHNCPLADDPDGFYIRLGTIVVKTGTDSIFSGNYKATFFFEYKDSGKSTVNTLEVEATGSFTNSAAGITIGTSLPDEIYADDVIKTGDGFFDCWVEYELEIGGQT